MSVRRKFVLPVVLVVLALGVGPGTAAEEDTTARILGAALMNSGAYDKVDRRDLDLNVAALAVLTYSLAERDEMLPRLEPTEE